MNSNADVFGYAYAAAVALGGVMGYTKAGAFNNIFFVSFFFSLLLSLNN